MGALSDLSRAFNTAGKVTRDLKAIKKGRVGQRATNRAAAHTLGRFTRKLWR